uniref:Uncharacterized protein n=1 Tax=Glossina pallidipes TaxID=7398 RepID=A0A1B0ACG8_GLOPL
MPSHDGETPEGGMNAGHPSVICLRPLAAHEILDALENVSDNEEDYRERLICILPPPVDPDCLTDEDSGEEDNNCFRLHRYTSEKQLRAV